MKKKRWAAILTASVLAASQAWAPVYGAADVNGKVYVNGDEVYGDTSEGSVNLSEDREAGSVTNTAGGAAVSVSDYTGKPEGKESASFKVDGDVSSDDSVTQESSWDEENGVTGVEVDIRDPDGEVSSVGDTVVEVTGNVTAEAGSEGYGNVAGIDIKALGAETKDQSVSVTVDGDVKAADTNTGEGIHGATGIVISTYSDDGGVMPLDDETAGSETDEQPHTMTTSVTAGSVTADGGAAADAEGIHVEAYSETAAQDVSVDIKGDVTAKAEDSGASGIDLSQRGRYDSSVKISVGGDVIAEGNGSNAFGVAIGSVGDSDEDAKATAGIDIGGDVKVKSTDPEGMAAGVFQFEDIAGDLAIDIGGSVTVEGAGEVFGVSAPELGDGGTGRVKVDGDVTASETGETGSATAITGNVYGKRGMGDVLVGGDATASGAGSVGIGLIVRTYNGGKETEFDEDPDAGTGGQETAGKEPAGKEPARIEVLGTVDGGEGGTDLLITLEDQGTDYEYNDETDDYDLVTSDPTPAEEVKAVLDEALPEIVTHEVKNGSIKADVASKNADNEKAVLEALAEKTFYTVNYSTKVTDENGAEDDSLGTITITQYDGKDLEKKELRYDGSSVYVAKAGDVIKINVKVTKDAVSKNKKEKTKGKAEVTTEETDTEIITTTKTPVTTTTWTETTTYELDPDKLQIRDTVGYDSVIKLKYEKNEAGETICTLEVTPYGGIDIDVEALIKAITEKTNLKSITEDVIEITRKNKPEEPQEEEKPAEQEKEKPTKPQEEVKPAEQQEEEKPAEQQEEEKPVPPEEGKTDIEEGKSNGGSGNGGGSGSGVVTSSQKWPNRYDRVYHGSGWIQDEIGWRYRNTDGSFVSGWALLPWNNENCWYYFNMVTHYMQSGWLNFGGSMYYLNPVSNGFMGAMVTGNAVIDGQEHYFETEAGNNQGHMIR